MIIFLVDSFSIPTEGITTATFETKKVCLAASKQINKESRYLETICVARY